MTTFRAAVSSTGSGTSRPWNHSYPSSGCFTARTVSTYSMMKPATHTQFFRRRVVSRETRSCRGFLRLAFTGRCARHNPPYAREDLFAFLDDTYITCPVQRVVPTFRALRSALAEYANIDIHLGKMRVWNAAGVEPEGLAAEVPPQPGRPPVWVGAHSLPAEQQGMVVLGTPLGSDAFVDAFLRQKIEAQASLFSKIPTVLDLQAAWLLLLMCAAPRCHYKLRALPPSSTAAFARSHDEAVLGCLRELLANDSPPLLDALATKRAQLPLHVGGLGLRSAETPRIAAHLASWADTLPTLRGRHLVVVDGLLSQAASQRRGAGGLLPCVAAALSSQSCLQRAGFDAPTWHQLIESTRSEEPAVHNFGDPLRGWQRAAWAATASLDAAACESLLSDLDPASRALLLSQAGLGCSRAITALPTSPELRMPSECMRAVLLRRLRLPLPHAP